LAAEIEVGLRGRRKADLDLLEAHLHQGAEHAPLALGAHRLDQRLVAVAQVDGAPDRGTGDDGVRPGPVRQLDGREGLVLAHGFLEGCRHGPDPSLASGPRRPLGARAVRASYTQNSVNGPGNTAAGGTGSAPAAATKSGAKAALVHRRARRLVRGSGEGRPARASLIRRLQATGRVSRRTSARPKLMTYG